MTAVSRLAVLAACALIVAFPQLAEACPTCAGKEPGGPARIVALGVMILLPFGIAFAMWRILRSHDREDGNR
jgi:hypothetical protein